MPLLFLLPVTIEILMGRRLPQTVYEELAPYYSFVFLDAFHIVFTFIILFLFSDLRGAVLNRRHMGMASVTWATVLFLTGMAAFWLLQSENYASDREAHPWVTLTAFALIPFFSSHLVLQSYGMSRLLVPRPAARVHSNRNRKRAAFALLIASIASTWISISAARFGIEGATWFAACKWSAVSFGLISAGYLIRGEYLLAGRRFDPGFWFSLRFLFFPLSSVSLLSLFAIIAFHAFEYAIVAEVYIRRAARWKPSRTFWLCVLGPLAWTGVFMASGFMKRLAPDLLGEAGMQVAAAISMTFFALGFCHRYLDSVMYKFGDPKILEIHRGIFDAAAEAPIDWAEAPATTAAPVPKTPRSPRAELSI